ncbi:hypothetical protein QTN25_010738 [Entamoeba marina]
MQSLQQHNPAKQLDSYSMLIVSKYLITSNDFINIICVNSKFKETTEKLRFNPIPIKSMKLFPKIQTQYLYSKSDKRMKGIKLWEIIYEVDYVGFIKNKKIGIKCHHVKYTKQNIKQYGNEIPNGVNSLTDFCYEEKQITSITMPNSVTSIGFFCIANKYNLTNVQLSNNLTSINSYTFNNCGLLKSITFPSSIQSIGSNSFNNCTSLESINLTTNITSIKSYSFQHCLSLKSVLIPTSISTLEDNCFNNCSSLTYIELPTSLILIGDNCFSHCSNLKTIKLPNSLKQIRKECFFNCGLESIKIPSSVISIGLNCFSKCTLLTNLQFESKKNEFIFEVSYNDSILYKQFGIKCSNICYTRNDKLYK